MNTTEMVRLFCDGRTSLHDIRALVVSAGHSPEAFAEAVGVLTAEPGYTIRVGAYQKGEYQSELYLTSADRNPNV